MVDELAARRTRGPWLNSYDPLVDDLRETMAAAFKQGVEDRRAWVSELDRGATSDLTMWRRQRDDGRRATALAEDFLPIVGLGGLDGARALSELAELSGRWHARVLAVDDATHHIDTLVAVQADWRDLRGSSAAASTVPIPTIGGVRSTVLSGLALPDDRVEPALAQLQQRGYVTLVADQEGRPVTTSERLGVRLERLRTDRPTSDPVAPESPRNRPRPTL